MPEIKPELMATMLDPENRHCMTCDSYETNINEKPCRNCLHEDPRGRPRWTPRRVEPAPVLLLYPDEETARKASPRGLPGQLSLFGTEAG